MPLLADGCRFRLYPGNEREDGNGRYEWQGTILVGYFDNNKTLPVTFKRVGKGHYATGGFEIFYHGPGPIKTKTQTMKCASEDNTFN